MPRLKTFASGSIIVHEFRDDFLDRRGQAGTTGVHNCVLCLKYVIEELYRLIQHFVLDTTLQIAVKRRLQAVTEELTRTSTK